MNLIKVFLLSVLLAIGGAAAGGAAGMNIAPGGLLIGSFIVGALFVIASAYLSARWKWISPPQKLWMMLGGAFGFILACMVALATIGAPGGLLASSILVGAGAVLGAIVGVSPHTKS